MKIIHGAILMLAATAAAGCRPVTASQAGPVIATAPLSITSSNGVHKFIVDVAQTPEQQERGLMFRARLADDRGMIFPMSPPRYASFWMKNTPEPLDIIFIRADNTIARIAAEAVPYALDRIDSGEPIAAVLEIRGGQAAALGIAEDDTVSWPH
jgi:uncharacterized protein